MEYEEAEGQKQGEDLRSYCNNPDRELANTLGFAGHSVSVTATQVHHWSMKAA